MAWVADGSWTRLNELEVGETFTTRAAINRWQRRGRRGAPVVLRREEDPKESSIVDYGTHDNPAPTVRTEASQAVVRVRRSIRPSPLDRRALDGLRATSKVLRPPAEIKVIKP